MFGKFFSSGLGSFSSSNEALKNIPTKESRMAEFLWVLNVKPQNHFQVSQKTLWGEKKKWFKGKKNLPHHPIPEPKLSLWLNAKTSYV